MDLAAASAGPWLVLGVVVGLVLAGALASAVRTARGLRPSAMAVEGQPEQPHEWVEDDLPGFLEQPPGTAAERGPAPGATTFDPPLAAPTARRRMPAHAVSGTPRPGRVLLVLASVAVLLIGVAAALGLVADGSAATVPAAGTSAAPSPSPTWEAPDLAALPAQPDPGDPGAGRLAGASLPVGDSGALSRLSFRSMVLERKAVGITAAYPSVSVTATTVPGGPALAHVVLPVWNCLTDDAPPDPAAAGCRRLPTEYAELPTPALTVTDDGDGLRISGRFPTYVRPAGSAPEWTGRDYPLAVRVRPDGDSAAGTLHLGSERAASVDDPRLSELRRGG